MTSEVWREMFEGDSADTCGEKIAASVDGKPSGGSRVRRPGSEDQGVFLFAASCGSRQKVREFL